MTKSDHVEKKLARAEYALREQLPGVGLVLIAAVPYADGSGFELYQVGNMVAEGIRMVLAEALADIDAGKGKVIFDETRGQR